MTRSGAPGEHVVSAAEAERADLIVLGWSQKLSTGRAGTVRQAILTSSVPVMLVPLVV